MYELIEVSSIIAIMTFICIAGLCVLMCALWRWGPQEYNAITIYKGYKIWCNKRNVTCYAKEENKSDLQCVKNVDLETVKKMIDYTIKENKN